MGKNLWAEVKQGAAAGVLAGGFPYAKSNWYVGSGAPVFGRRVDTIKDLFAIAEPGDIAFLGPGFYDEGNLVLPASLSNFTLIGAGNRGSVGVQSTVVGKEGIQVKANDVTFINVGIEVEDTADYALNVNGNRPGGVGTKNGARFRAYGCKFEGPTGTVVLLDGDANYQAADALFDDCEFCWGGSGLVFDDSLFGFPSQVRVKRSLFHNLTAAGIGEATNGGVVDLWVEDCDFSNLEDATPPTVYVKVDRAGDTGLITNCRFAVPTNITARLKIAAGIMWVGNHTESGETVARPV
jgi:hypothetical protein